MLIYLKKIKKLQNLDLSLRNLTVLRKLVYAT